MFFLITGLLAIVFPAELPIGHDSDRLLPPLSSGHYLGTDHMGRDVLLMLYNGTGYTIMIALPSCLIIWLIGVGIGLVAGLPGYARLHLPWQVLAAAFGAAWPAAYYLLYLPLRWPDALISLAIPLIIFFFLLLIFRRFIVAEMQIVPARLAQFFIELMSVFPRLLFVFVFTSLFSGRSLTLILLLGFTGWAGLARVVWTETKKIYVQPYMEAALAMGFTESYRLLRYVLPAVLPLSWVVLSFSFSGIIMAEASLSFLEVGLPPEATTWGRMILSAKSYPEAWWLIVLPVLLIFALTFSLHRFSWFISAKLHKNGFELVS